MVGLESKLAEVKEKCLQLLDGNFKLKFSYTLLVHLIQITVLYKFNKREFICNLGILPVDFFWKLIIIKVEMKINTGSLAEGIMSADPGTPLLKK